LAKLGIIRHIVDFWKNLGGDNPERRSFFRYAIISTALLLLFVGFFSDDSILRWGKACVQKHQQEKQIARYKEQNEQMDKQIKMLSTDKDTLEKFARENFNFAEPGDDVYLIDK